MKRLIATLLMICMLLTMLPVMPAQAAGKRPEAPAGVTFKIVNNTLEIGFEDDPLTKEEKAWLADIVDIEINGFHYREVGHPDTIPNQAFERVEEEDETVSSIQISNHNLSLPSNDIKILAPNYQAYTTTYSRPEIEKMADGLSIIGVALGHAGDEHLQSDGMSINLRYDYNSSENGALNTLMTCGLKSVTIDGKTFSVRDAQDGRQSFFLRETVLSAWDKTPDGKLIVDHFKKHDKHQVIMTFNDDSSVKYEDKGYQDPNKESEKEEDPPSGAVDKNTGGMAAGWEFVKFEQAANDWNGARMASDIPQDQWYKKYVENIRYVLIDDSQLADKQEKPGDITLQGEVLAFAVYGRVFNNDPHKMVIGFKDGSTLTHIDAGYEGPQKPFDIDKYLKENPTRKEEAAKPATGEVSKKYVIESADFVKGYGDPELVVKFKNVEHRLLIEDIQSFTVNGKTYDNSNLWTLSWKGMICNDQSVIQPLYGKDQLDLTFLWKDGSHTTIIKKITPVTDPKGPQKPEKPAEPELSNEEQVLSDDDETVQVTAPAGALPKDVSLSLTERSSQEVADLSPAYGKIIADKKNVSAFDISLYSNNQKVQPKKPVKVSLPLGSHDKDSLAVYHLKAGGQSEPVKAQVENGRVIFTADSFSIYLLTSGKKEKEKPAVDQKKMADQLAITGLQEKMNWMGELDSVVLQCKDIEKKSTEERTKLAASLKAATWTVNGETFTNQEIGYTQGGLTGYEVYGFNADLITAYKKQKPAAVKITFTDGSSWDNGVQFNNESSKKDYALTDKLPDGDYTLTFAASKPDGSPSMMVGFLDKKAKLTVAGNQKTVTFLITSNANLLLDFACSEKGKEQFASAKDEVYGKASDNCKTYTVPVETLDKKYQLAILNAMMNGQISDKGNYTKYTKVDLSFTPPVIKGWTGFNKAENPAFDQGKNDDNLRLKLIAAGVDTNGDGRISKEELQNARGKLDLSNEKIGPSPDVSILKDLGPNVSELYLDANGIESLPDGFFDHMTGLGQVSLSGNKLTALPKNTFAKNKNLHTVWMEGNELTELAADLFANNPELKEVAISRNKIDRLPEGFFNKNSKLKVFYASGNQISRIEEGTFGDMKRLTKLDLSDNRLTELPADFNHFAQLEELSLANNRLTSLPDGISKFGRLYKLNISNNQIKDINEKIWQKMARNSLKYRAKYPNLDVSGNLLTDIPFDKMLAQGPAFNKFDVSRNYLPASLSQDQVDKLSKLGIHIGSGMENLYQPQLSAMKASLQADKGEITLNQDLDMLQMAFWEIKDFHTWDSFLSPEAYLTFLKDKIYKSHNITTINDHLGIAQILDKMNFDWQIRTVIEKKEGDSYREISNELLENEGHNGTLSDVDPLDDYRLTFKDPDMKAGDCYRLTRTLQMKSNQSDYKPVLRYSLEAKAKSAVAEKKDTAWEVPAELWKADKDEPSMAASVLGHKALVSKTDEGYKVQLTFTPLTIGSITGYLQALEVYESKDDQIVGKARALPLKDVKRNERGMTAASFMTADKPQNIYYLTVTYTIGSAPANRSALAVPGKAPTSTDPVRLRLNWEKAKAVTVAETDPDKEAAKSALEKAIKAAQDKLADGKTYTDASKTAVEKALTDAQAALDQDTATMQAATDTLNKAVTGLEEKAVDQVETVPIKVFKANEDKESMSSKAVIPEAKVQKVAEGWQVDVSFQPMKVMGLTGHLEKAYVYDKLEDMKAKNAKDLRKGVEVIDRYTEKDKDYPKTIRFISKDKPKVIGLCVVVDMMRAMGGDGEADLRLIFDWPEEKPVVDKDKEAAKAALTKAIDQAKAKLTDGKTYTDASKSVLDKALTEAKAALDKDTAAMQVATAALNKAVADLKEKPVVDKDKEAAKASLEKAIKAGQDKLADGKTYTDASKAAVDKALTEAQAALDKDTAAMQAATNALNEAVAGLKEKAVDQVETVPIKVFKANEDKESMASGAVIPEAKVQKVAEGWQVDVSFQPMKVMGLTGHLEKAYVYDKLEDMKAKNAKDLRKGVEVIDRYTEKDKDYPKTIRFISKDKPKVIGLCVVVDMMGNGEADLRLIFDWPEEKPAVDKDKEAAKAALTKAIDQAKVKLADGKSYTDDSKATVEKALTEAQAALDKDTAAMQAATNALNKAVAGLKEKPVVDKDKEAAKAALTKAIDQAKAKLADGKTYTDDSRAAVQAALAKAQAALDKDTVEMKKATKALEQAVDKLQRVTKSEPEEKEFTVKAFIRHASKDAYSMANKAFYPQVEVLEKDGEVSYTLYFKSLSVMGQQGRITAVTVDGQEAEQVTGRDSEYSIGYRFTRNRLKEDEIKLSFNVDMMAGMTQDAILVLDWSGSTLKPKKGAGDAGLQAEEDKAFADKELKALLDKAEKLMKEDKYSAKDLAALKRALKDGKEAKDEATAKRAKKALIEAMDALKKDQVQQEEAPEQAGNKAFSLTQPTAGYISGYPNGTFRPASSVSRAEAAAMLAKFVVVNKPVKASVKDLPADRWYSESMKTLISAGLLSGYEDGTVRPDRTMTRAEMIALIVRMKSLASQPATYTDLSVGHWAYQMIGSAQAAGIVSGYPDGSFKPDQEVSRAEMVAMINRAFAYKGSGGDRTFTDLTPDHWAYQDIQKAARA